MCYKRKTGFIILSVGLLIASIILVLYVNRPVASYDHFTKLYNQVVNEFLPENCVVPIDLSQKYTATAFPENSLFLERDDLYDGDIRHPKMRKILYQNSNGAVFVVSFIYSSIWSEPHILANNKTPNEVFQVLSLGRDFERHIYQDVLMYTDAIIIIDYYINQDPFSASETDKTLFYESSADFFREFADFLSALPKNHIDRG